MKMFGWIVLILGLLGCIFAGFVGVVEIPERGLHVIGIALAALGGVYAGVNLIEQSGQH